MRLDTLPLTSNGKIDRRALLALEPNASSTREDEPITAPSELEAQMVTLVAEVIGVPEVRVDQNFFDAGATSLHIVMMAKRLSALFKRDVPATLLFQSPNVRALAAACAGPRPNAVSLDKPQARAQARRQARSNRG